MERRIQKAAVLGSGVMGAAIAAHLANAGIQTLLLDIVPNKLTEKEEAKGLTLEHSVVRNRIAAEAKERLLKVKPAPLFVQKYAELIAPGNLEDDLSQLKEVDWIIEAIVENLGIKQQLFARVEQNWSEGTIVSSNTSGVSINSMVEGRGEAFRKHFLGTHFFNPPRYMKLLEIIPGSDTAKNVIAYMKKFGERTLGKGVVLAKDTPNFIGNRIGVYGLMVTVAEMVRGGWTIEQVDAMTGAAVGHPKSATFRTLDMVGLDTFVHVANNVHNLVQDQAEKQIFVVPEMLTKLVENGWLGDKRGQGFYQKKKTAKGRELNVLDYHTFEYVPVKKEKLAAVEQAKQAGGLRKRIAALAYSHSREGEFTWNVLKKVLLYSASKVPEIADDIVNVDRAMKWGFNWELGPFETWDALGVRKSVERMKQEGETIPQWVEEMLASGMESFYEEEGGKKYFHALTGERAEEEASRQVMSLKAFKKSGTVLSNSGASLIDIGDGVACLEFHSPNNAIGFDIIEMLYKSLDEVERNYRGLVITNEAKNFCVGANLMMILMEAQDDNWDDINHLVKRFQHASLAIKYSKKPVVAAPFGMTLGGGAEICLPAAKIQANAETYMGLVEVGVGVIPGGAGTKEVLLRTTQEVDRIDNKADLTPFVIKAFEKIAMAKVSTSAEEARELGFLRRGDQVTMNRDHLLYDAKQSVLALDATGYQPPRKERVRVVGRDGKAVLQIGAYTMRESGYISEHDLKIANKLAHVLAGGDVNRNMYVTEEYLLDLEREAFLSLCGEPKSQQRMQYMLTKGKPLRN
ncbi:3-hydroxyacyl-CoA dehydrogenase/enoyl-CoA hydratase family protein [Aneurinibacillus sp. Ricciae_BoGa-3]|uniref:3-hydroxyacyl-CoA dehydrogenase/enoyl-CoA hydratase family protein n=1 Tax=Aneurinibacillus sp. Ricciae_BoGa-3 TaxID=3022697 RepID=UPI00233FD52B|nr:3-hydroxyacyl-CoA dehydrogenase/enoyl-CoA hydratase family protein [Aneurinibacillus sp. Ricciae_BoGa-3]WCK52781.1 3-hydroxyacyl-CoA dehydrogenase/enoyl-CoA hydratase family protein [Aneurinibacillus sp. Ricciae_BoGa-3]